MVAKSLLILLPIFLSYVCVLGFPKEVQIVGLFDQDEDIETMFEMSVHAVNQDRFNKSKKFSTTYLLAVAEAITMDLHETSKTVCELLDAGIVGVFGPQEKVTAEYVQSICNAIEVPYISVRQDLDQSFQARGLNLNLYPHVNSLSRIYNQLVIEFKWKSFAILYENNDSLIRMRLLMKRWDSRGYSAYMYYLGNGPNYRRSMQEIKTSNIENIIIDCSSEILSEVLMQAQQVGILSEKYKVIVTSLDLQTLDLEPYQYSGVNFTGVRLIDPEDPIVRETFDRHKWNLNDSSQLRVEPALMYDAVQLFAKAFKQLKDAIKGDVKALKCDDSSRWEHGLSLSNFMRSTETRGLTGLVKFDRDGFRSNIDLDIIHLTEDGLKKIGQWNSSAGESIDWLPENTLNKLDNKMSIQNKTFIVLITTGTPPYGMEKESTIQLSGNDRYEGFTIDIIQEISEILGFNYTFQVESGAGKKEGGKWNGMLGKIMADEADLAITDLTITKERVEDFDFSNPILNLGISILFKKPTKAPPSLFSFLLPFSTDVWIYLIGAYVIVSVLMFIIGRLCPAEWNNPYPCIEEAEELENQFTLKNAFWFSIGSIMQQGSEIAPIGISTRMIASCWWFFTLIMVSSYTANLAAFLTVETIVRPFNNVEELANSKNIKYGAKTPGATLRFFEDFVNFKESSYPIYQKMYQYMNTHDVLVTESNDGIARVASEDNYAFLMESVSIEYEVERNCNITQVGGLLDEKGYGIGMKKNSPYLHDINTALLKLSEGGKIQEIKKKWWTQKRGGGKCQENAGSGGADPLDLDNVGGVFLVLAVGVALSCVYTILELFWDVFQKSTKENVSFKQELINEVKFILKFSDSKPLQKNGLSSKSENGSTRECTPPYGFMPKVIRTSPNDN
ncbi:glutamate receptor ionotropic, kainate 2 isoform X1 [Solenopsis invicta]|uniref:glutamate receptor ionotropic, kainate 2 isoform X1 n=1 Tax=Solenopsis invicta TaxID=13686 RepID=UPI00193E0DF0|nr:glutamate receptor ionotropic, kainate 2 isoform X1 [Solenopsis invicta]XP_039303727.1 glutamate receptor ionotropic, kainate 2 isoform X1 [Solenopsis invicta]